MLPIILQDRLEKKSTAHGISNTPEKIFLLGFKQAISQGYWLVSIGNTFSRQSRIITKHSKLLSLLHHGKIFFILFKKEKYL